MDAVWFKSGHRRGGLTGEMAVVVCLSLGGRDVSDGRQQSVMMEPGHPFQRGEFQGLHGLPGLSAIDQFGFVEPTDGLGQRVVVAVALAADRRLDAGLGQPLAVADADVLRPADALLYVKWRFGSC